MALVDLGSLTKHLVASKVVTGRGDAVVSENETSVLALLLALAAALYMLTWSIAGPVAYPEAPAATSPDGTLPARVAP
jgi:hypothetical protein